MLFRHRFDCDDPLCTCASIVSKLSRSHRKRKIEQVASIQLVPQPTIDEGHCEDSLIDALSTLVHTSSNMKLNSLPWVEKDVVASEDRPAQEEGTDIDVMIKRILFEVFL